MRAIQSLMTVGEALAEGQEIDVSQETLDAFELVPVEQEEAQEWSLDLGDVEVETLDGPDSGEQGQIDETKEVEEAPVVADSSEVAAEPLRTDATPEETEVEEAPEAVEVEAVQPEAPALTIEEAGEEAEAPIEAEQAQELAVEATESTPADEGVDEEAEAVEVPSLTQAVSEMAEVAREVAVSAEAEQPAPSSDQGGRFFTEEEMEERDLLWQDAFEALKAIQQGFAQLSNALLKLNEQDYRD